MERANYGRRRRTCRGKLTRLLVLLLYVIKTTLIKGSICGRYLIADGIEIKILSNRRCPSLAAAGATNPQIAVNHTVTDDGTLLGITALVQDAQITSMSHAALTMRTNALSQTICRILLTEYPSLLLKIIFHLLTFDLTIRLALLTFVNVSQTFLNFQTLRGQFFLFQLDFQLSCLQLRGFQLIVNGYCFRRSDVLWRFS